MDLPLKRLKMPPKSLSQDIDLVFIQHIHHILKP